MNFSTIFFVAFGTLGAFGATGCSETTSTQRLIKKECITDEQQVRLAQFIVDCAKAANPMSDEEPEDLVIECRNTGYSVLCPAQKVCRQVISRGFPDGRAYGSWGPCSE